MGFYFIQPLVGIVTASVLTLLLVFGALALLSLITNN